MKIYNHDEHIENNCTLCKHFRSYHYVYEDEREFTDKYFHHCIGGFRKRNIKWEEIVCDETNNTKETLEERKIIIDIKSR